MTDWSQLWSWKAAYPIFCAELRKATIQKVSGTLEVVKAIQSQVNAV
jgi:hypothetical protein